MSRRRPGLQRKWAHVVNSLQEIVPSYEVASSRISLFADSAMRQEAVRFAVNKGSIVLDLGAGPGTMSSLVAARGGVPVLLDVSGNMLRANKFPNRVRATFEDLPFRDGSFDAVVSGFALRDSRDLLQAVGQVARVLKGGGRFGFCDLGKPDSAVNEVGVGFYLRVVPNVIGLASAGRSGLRYGSLFDTYVLVPHNRELVDLLERFFVDVTLHAKQLGGAIVMKCAKGSPGT